MENSGKGTFAIAFLISRKFSGHWAIPHECPLRLACVNSLPGLLLPMLRIALRKQLQNCSRRDCFRKLLESDRLFDKSRVNLNCPPGSIVGARQGTRVLSAEDWSH